MKAVTGGINLKEEAGERKMKKLVFYTIIAAMALPLMSGSVMAKDAIDFAAIDINGNRIKLSDYYNGKVVLLDFWATWCPPCRKEIPNLIDIKNTFKGKNFEIISVDGFERGKDTLAVEFVKQHKMNWIHIIDKRKGGEIAKQYNVMYIPTMYVIKDGKIVASNLRGEALKNKIKELVD